MDPWQIFTSNFGHVGMPFTAFVTLLDIGLYFFLTYNVGRARGRYKIQAPAVDGPEAFQRVMRVHVNTVEQLLMHLPLLWLAAFAMNDVFAAAFGAVWLLSRILYARGYYRKAKSRMKGFLIGIFINVVLFVGALAGTVASF